MVETRRLIQESTNANIHLACTQLSRSDKKQPWRPLSMIPLPQVLSAYFSLPQSNEVVPLSGRSIETSQSEGRCHNKQKHHSYPPPPPKSNQEPLIHAMNGDWVPWEWLIQWDHRRHHWDLHNSTVYFSIIPCSPLDSTLSTQRWCNHHSSPGPFYFTKSFVYFNQLFFSLWFYV